MHSTFRIGLAKSPTVFVSNLGILALFILILVIVVCYPGTLSIPTPGLCSLHRYTDILIVVVRGFSVINRLLSLKQGIGLV